MLDLRHDAAAAAEARAAAAAAFARYGMPADLAQDGLLVVSELVANAVVHGAAPVRLEITGEPGRVLVTVHDAAAGTPEQQAPDADPAADRGRGLRIVTALARDWGCVRDADGPGKRVWAELAW